MIGKAYQDPDELPKGKGWAVVTAPDWLGRWAIFYHRVEDRARRRLRRRKTGSAKLVELPGDGRLPARLRDMVPPPVPVVGFGRPAVPAGDGGLSVGDPAPARRRRSDPAKVRAAAVGGKPAGGRRAKGVAAADLPAAGPVAIQADGVANPADAEARLHDRRMKTATEKGRKRKEGKRKTATAPPKRFFRIKTPGPWEGCTAEMIVEEVEGLQCRVIDRHGVPYLYVFERSHLEEIEP